MQVQLSTTHSLTWRSCCITSLAKSWRPWSVRMPGSSTFLTSPWTASSSPSPCAWLQATRHLCLHVIEGSALVGRRNLLSLGLGKHGLLAAVCEVVPRASKVCPCCRHAVPAPGTDGNWLQARSVVQRQRLQGMQQCLMLHSQQVFCFGRAARSPIAVALRSGQASAGIKRTRTRWHSYLPAWRQ